MPTLPSGQTSTCFRTQVSSLAALPRAPSFPSWAQECAFCQGGWLATSLQTHSLLRLTRTSTCKGPAVL